MHVASHSTCKPRHSNSWVVRCLCEGFAHVCTMAAGHGCVGPGESAAAEKVVEQSELRGLTGVHND